jgi:hypothetical protein
MRIGFLGLAKGRFIHVAHGYDSGAVQTVEVPDDVGAPVPVADDAHADHDFLLDFIVFSGLKKGFNLPNLSAARGKIERIEVRGSRFEDKAKYLNSFLSL